VNVQRNHDGRNSNICQSQVCRELIYIVACGSKPPAISLDNESSLRVDSDDDNVMVADDVVVSDEISQFHAEFEHLWKEKVLDRAKSRPPEYVNAYKAIVGALKNVKSGTATIGAMHRFAEGLNGGKHD